MDHAKQHAWGPCRPSKGLKIHTVHTHSVLWCFMCFQRQCNGSWVPQVVETWVGRPVGQPTGRAMPNILKGPWLHKQHHGASITRICTCRAGWQLVYMVSVHAIGITCKPLVPTARRNARSCTASLWAPASGPGVMQNGPSGHYSVHTCKWYIFHGSSGLSSSTLSAQRGLKGTPFESCDKRDSSGSGLTPAK